MIYNITKIIGCTVTFLLMAYCTYVHLAITLSLKIIVSGFIISSFLLIFFPKIRKSYNKIKKRKRQENPDILDDFKF